MRAAASSIASGRPSTARQIWRDDVSQLIAHSARNPARRSLRRALRRRAGTAGSTASGGTGNSCSPLMCSGLAAAAQDVRSGRGGAAVVATSACGGDNLLEVVEHDQRLALAQVPRASVSIMRPRSPAPLNGHTRPMAGGTSSGSVIVVERHEPGPAREALAEHCAATSIDSRVLPVPPGPVSVTRRASLEQVADLSRSRASRPTKAGQLRRAGCPCRVERG